VVDAIAKEAGSKQHAVAARTKKGVAEWIWCRLLKMRIYGN
jgi:hypothetical protein